MCLMCLSRLLASRSLRMRNIIGFKLNISPISGSPGQCLCEGRHMFSTIRHYLSGLAGTSMATPFQFPAPDTRVRDQRSGVPGSFLPCENELNPAQCPVQIHASCKRCAVKCNVIGLAPLCVQWPQPRKEKTQSGLNSPK